MEAKPQYLNGKGYGLVFGDPKKIYSRVGSNYIIVKDVGDNQVYGSNSSGIGDSSMDPAERLFVERKNNSLRIDIVRSDTLLKYFITIYKKFMTQYRGENKDEVNKKAVTASHTFFNTIFVEMGPYVKHTIEYACLMYMCLLHMGIELPEFYLIVGFPTTNFDYLEHFIFNDPAQGRSVASIDEELKDLRSSGAVSLDVTPNVSNLTLVTITEITDSKPVIIITQDQYGWNDHISMHVKRSTIKFKNLREYKIWFRETKSSDLLPIVTIDNPVELLSENLVIGMIIFDTRIKVEIDLHYLGNAKRSREATPDWYDYYLKLLTIEFPEAKLVFDRMSDHEPVVRGTKERSPINDVFDFSRDGINLHDLYTHYYNNTTEYTYAIKSSIDTLGRLGYFGKNRPSLLGDLHPIFPRMMQIWADEKKFPRFAFLIVIAIVQSYSHKHTEISKDDEKSSRFKDMLDHYLAQMEKYENPYPSDMYGINRSLRKLADKYMRTGATGGETGGDTISTYDSEDIIRGLIDIIRENFDYYILTLRGDSYRSKSNQNLVWQLMVDNSDGNGLLKEVFPLVVYSTSRKRKVALYIPLYD